MTCLVNGIFFVSLEVDISCTKVSQLLVINELSNPSSFLSPLLLRAGSVGLVGQAELHVPLVVLVQLHEDHHEADELDGVQGEAHRDGNLHQGCQVMIRNKEGQKMATLTLSQMASRSASPVLRFLM